MLFLLPGWLGSRLPSPLDESIATQHMKAYVFDDTLIMSGANLSHDYFTNRQDRALQFARSPHLANFYHDVIDDLARSSYLVHTYHAGIWHFTTHSKSTSVLPASQPLPIFPGMNTQLCLTAPTPPYRKQMFSSSFWERHLEKCSELDLGTKKGNDMKSSQEEDNAYDSWAFPTFQFPPGQVSRHDTILILGALLILVALNSPQMTYDEDLTVDVMSSVDGGKLYIATGYMNFSARLILFGKKIRHARPFL
jgi:hypothetical protein